VEDLFEEIYDIRVASYLPKPQLDPYLRVLEHLGIAGSRCIMVEDSRENLRTAKELGMGTVLVGGGECPAYVDAQVPAALHVPAALSRYWGLAPSAAAEQDKAIACS
jgi:putative hydrolase of the HAD superfamily